MAEELHFGRRETGAAFLTAAALGLAAASLLGHPASAQALRAPDVLYGPGGPVRAPTELASLGPPSAARVALPQRLERAGARPSSEPAALSSRRLQSPPAGPSSRGLGPLKIGAPYQVNGVWYVPAHEPDYDEEVIASWYGGPFHGQLTANGEVYDQFAMTGAHPTLPLPSLVDVTNLENGRRVTVRLNDRGPFVPGRSLDLSQAAALALGMRESGTARTRVRYLGPGTPQGANERLTAGSAAGVGPPGGQFGPAPKQEADTRPTEPMSAGEPQARPQTQLAAYQPAALAATISAAPLEPPKAVAAGYFVQVGAFAALANAERARTAVSVVGAVAVRPAVVNGATMFRVVLGPWPNSQGAEATLTRLSAIGHTDARIVRLSPAP